MSIGVGWLVFIRVDKKEKNTNTEQEWLSIQNRKIIDYNL